MTHYISGMNGDEFHSKLISYHMIKIKNLIRNQPVVCLRLNATGARKHRR